MRLSLTLALVLLVAFACSGSGDAGETPVSPTVTATAPNGTPIAFATATVAVTDGSDREELTVELAVTPDQRGRGLMFREEMAENAGMLFVFETDVQSAFWMRNTLIPLSIAFIREDGTIIDIQDMEPLSEELHRPSGKYRFALEVNQGWFRRHGFGPGDRVELREVVLTPTPP